MWPLVWDAARSCLMPQNVVCIHIFPVFTALIILKQADMRLCVQCITFSLCSSALTAAQRWNLDTICLPEDLYRVSWVQKNRSERQPPAKQQRQWPHHLQPFVWSHKHFTYAFKCQPDHRQTWGEIGFKAYGRVTVGVRIQACVLQMNKYNATRKDVTAMQRC